MDIKKITANGNEIAIVTAMRFVFQMCSPHWIS
jgi:hypothetical protein